MKKRKFNFILLFVILATVLSLSLVGGVFAKYIINLGDGGADVTAPNYYFRSSALSEDESNIPTITVNGSITSFSVSNGINSSEYTARDITYSLEYYVKQGDSWVLAEGAGQSNLTLAGGRLSSEIFTVSPISIDGNSYDEIKIVAKATSPYEKSLYAIAKFVHTGHTVSFTREGSVIFLRLATNMDEGTYKLSWAEGISPDNADENGILNGSVKGPSSVTSSLPKYHLYEFKFFLTDADILSALDLGTLTLESLIVTEYNA